jgi:hypothetical protein
MQKMCAKVLRKYAKDVCQGVPTVFREAFCHEHAHALLVQHEVCNSLLIFVIKQLRMN